MVQGQKNTCYATDTIADQSTFKWASNVKLMFHECWSEKKDNSGHSSFEEIVELSSYLNNGKIYLIHQNTDISIEEYEKWCEKHSNIFVARDLMEIQIK